MSARPQISPDTPPETPGTPRRLRADASAETVVLRADLVVDRTRFAMTWSPLGMASATARATVVARFVRP